MRIPFNAQEIKKAAELLGSRRALAKAINISYQSVSEWINGNKTPSPENCLRIERATGGQVKAKDILQLESFDPWKTLRQEHIT